MRHARSAIVPALRSATAILAVATLLAACGPQAARIELAPNEKLLITRAVWEDFLAYKQKAWSGAFVVSETGNGSGYVLCPGFNCRPYNYVRLAINKCEDAGVRCVLFAKDREIVVDYEIVD